MDKIQFQKRELTGKNAKKLIKESLMPAVIYNDKGESFTVQLPLKEGVRLSRKATSTTVIEATFEKADMKVVVKEIDYHPITDEIRHMSFFQIDETKPMTFSIPFRLTGVSPAVKNNLGVLVKTLNSLEVKCKVTDLIPEIVIDISALDHPGQTISVSDISLPQGVTLPNDNQKDTSIVTITQLQKLEEEIKPTTEGEEVATEEEGEKTEEATE